MMISQLDPLIVMAISTRMSVDVNAMTLDATGLVVERKV